MIPQMIDILAFDADDTLWDNGKSYLQAKVNLILITKGDSFERGQKIKRFGLSNLGELTVYIRQLVE